MKIIAASGYGWYSLSRTGCDKLLFIYYLLQYEAVYSTMVCQLKIRVRQTHRTRDIEGENASRQTATRHRIIDWAQRDRHFENSEIIPGIHEGSSFRFFLLFSTRPSFVIPVRLTEVYYITWRVRCIYFKTRFSLSHPPRTLLLFHSFIISIRGGPIKRIVWGFYSSPLKSNNVKLKTFFFLAI